VSQRRGIFTLPDGEEMPVVYCEIDESGGLKERLRQIFARPDRYRKGRSK